MSQRRGFTLIELLVVIAIIAILAAILFPVFAQAREAARKTQCTSNMKQAATATMMYVQDFDECFPTTYHVQTGGTPPQYRWYDRGGTPIQNAHNKVQPYVKNLQVFICPSDQNPSGKSITARYGGNDQPGTSYAYNCQFVGNGGAWGLASSNQNLWPNEPPVTTAQVLRSSDKVMWIEQAGHFWAADDNPTGIAWFTGTNTGALIRQTAASRHHGTVIVGFCDGHAKALKAEQIVPSPANAKSRAYWTTTQDTSP